MENIDLLLEAIKSKYIDELHMFEIQRKNITRLWNIDQTTGEFLFKLVLEKKPDRIIEVGTSNGFSTFWLSRAAEILQIEVDTIDADYDRNFLAKDNLRGFTNINFYLGTAKDVIPTLANCYDFFFLDANKSLYLDILKSLQSHLNKNCWIIADNTVSHKNTVNEYLDFVRNNDSFETKSLDIGQGLEFTTIK